MKPKRRLRKRGLLSTSDRLALLDRATPKQIREASKGCMGDLATPNDIKDAWELLRRAVGR